MHIHTYTYTYKHWYYTNTNKNGRNERLHEFCAKLVDCTAVTSTGRWTTHWNIVKYTEHGGPVGSFRSRETAGSYLQPANAILPDTLRGLPQSLLEITVKCLTLGDNSCPPLSCQFTLHSSALNIPSCWQRRKINQAHIGGHPLGRPGRYRDNIKMDNRELDCENGNKTMLHVAQRTQKFIVVHNKNKTETEIVNMVSLNKQIRDASYYSSKLYALPSVRIFQFSKD
jgi:hypothetical protein